MQLVWLHGPKVEEQRSLKVNPVVCFLNWALTSWSLSTFKSLIATNHLMSGPVFRSSLVYAFIYTRKLVGIGWHFAHQFSLDTDSKFRTCFSARLREEEKHSRSVSHTVSSSQSWGSICSARCNTSLGSCGWEQKGEAGIGPPSVIPELCFLHDWWIKHLADRAWKGICIISIHEKSWNFVFPLRTLFKYPLACVYVSSVEHIIT